MISTQATQALRRLALYSLVLLLGLGSVWLWLKRSGEGPRNSVVARPVALAVPEEGLDFGEVWAQKDFQWILPVANHSKRYVAILDLYTQCGCARTQIGPEVISIPPGQSAEIPLSLDLTSNDPAAISEPVRRMEVDLALKLAHGLPPARFLLHGKVRYPLIPRPAFIQYGQSLTEGMPFTSRQVTIEALTPLRELRVECDPAFGSVVMVPPTDLRPDEHLLTFTPHPGLREGPFSTQIELVGVSGEGELLPPVPVAVVGEVLPEIRPVPERLDLGVYSGGDSAKGAVVLQSALGRSFEVSDVAVSKGSTHVAVDAPRLQAAPAHILTVSLESADLGHIACEIRVTVRTADGEFRDVLIPVSAHRVAGNR